MSYLYALAHEYINPEGFTSSIKSVYKFLKKRCFDVTFSRGIR